MEPQPVTQMKPPRVCMWHPPMLLFYPTLKGLDEKSKIKINCIHHMRNCKQFMLGKCACCADGSENFYISKKNSGLELGEEQTDGLGKCARKLPKPQAALLVFALINSLYTSCSVMLVFLISPVGGAAGYWSIVPASDTSGV